MAKPRTRTTPSPLPRPRKSKRPRKPKQLELSYRTWGGKRRGAGRKVSRPGTVSHRKRPALASAFPVHVSMRVSGDIPTLRQPDVRAAIEDCLREVAALAEKRGFRVVHYSIQRHHLHMIVEAKDRQALSRGVQGLTIRLARRINKALGRTGKVFVDRYFERILKTPKQVRHCLSYVLNNARRHAAQRGQLCQPGWIDPCSSGEGFDGWRGVRKRAPPAGAPVSIPRTWLLSKGWRRHGLIDVDAVPGTGR